MNKDEATFLAKLRDAFAMAAEACNDYLNTEQPTYQKATASAGKPQEQTIIADVKVGELLSKFPQELRPLITITDAMDFWFVKPVKFLGKDAFADASEVVRGLNGKYERAAQGVKAHWEIPK